MDSGDEYNSRERNDARQERFEQNQKAKVRLTELEAKRSIERQEFERQGLINVGQTELEDAVDMKGTCQAMCCEYEQAKREVEVNVNPLEKDHRGFADPRKMVAIYTRSDAGAGHGDAMKLPSDLRTPEALVRSLDYLIGSVMSTPNPSSTKPPTPRRSLGYTAGYIRDRTRAIRKEFTLQSSWGHREAINCLERIARYHILSLRELQEGSGNNSDMHIDNAELGRCFTSLRQQYDDLREMTGEDMPCPNEPELRAYMLIYDLNIKSVAVSTSELPSIIFDHPLVQLAFEIRKAAQRNFDTQKEGSKHNAELGLNMITRVIKLLKKPECPFLFSCLVEIRLREMRRSALRALRQVYLPLKSDPLVVRDGQVVEKKMFLVDRFESFMGCEREEKEESAWDDAEDFEDQDEGVRIARKFGFEIYPPNTYEGVMPEGIIVHKGIAFEDNEDAPYTRRWASTTAKRDGLAFVDIVNGNAGVAMGKSTSVSASRPAFAFPNTSTTSLRPSAPAFKPISTPPIPPLQAATLPSAVPKPSAPTSFFNFGGDQQKIAPASTANVPPKPMFTFPSHSVTTLSSNSTPPPAPTAVTRQPAPIPPVPAFSFTPSVSVPTPTQPVPTPAASTSAATAPTTAPFAFSFSTPSAVASSSAPTATVNVPVATPPPAIAPVTVVQPSNIPAPNPVVAPPSTQPALPRRECLRAATAVSGAIIESVLATILDRLESGLHRAIDHELDARSYISAKHAREDETAHTGETVYKEILAEVVDEMAEEVVLEEIRSRVCARNAGKRWRAYAQTRIEKRATRKKHEEDMYGRLGKMGLGGSVRASIIDFTNDEIYDTPRNGFALLPDHTRNDYDDHNGMTPSKSNEPKKRKQENSMDWEIAPDLATLFGVFEDVQPEPLTRQPMSQIMSNGDVFGSGSVPNGTTIRGTKRDRSLGRVEAAETKSAKAARLEEAMRSAAALLA